MRGAGGSPPGDPSGRSRTTGAVVLRAGGGPDLGNGQHRLGQGGNGIGEADDRAGGGNAPVWICADADIRAATESVVLSKPFDHGIIWGSEQHLLVDAAIATEVAAELRRAGAMVLSRAETAELAATFFLDGRPRRDLLGHSAADIAAHAGIDVDANVRLLVAPVEDSAEGLLDE
jgi:acetaldehyde dehydrogenase/alcohol dehydrogenase